MRDYNFMNNYSRYSDSNYRFKGLYDDKLPRKLEYTENFEQSKYYEGLSKAQTKVESQSQIEIQNSNIISMPNLPLIQPQIHIPIQAQYTDQEKRNEEGERDDDRHRNYRHDYSSYKSSRDDRHEPRSRHYISSENKYRYSRERRSSHRRSSHRHSSRSRRSSSRK